jgi:hypothetical protein
MPGRLSGRVSAQPVISVLRRSQYSDISLLLRRMFALLAFTQLNDVNTINTWAEPHNANGVTPNSVIDSNDEPAGNNQQRMAARGY